MESRMMRAGLQRVLQLGTHHSRLQTLPLRPALARPSSHSSTTPLPRINLCQYHTTTPLRAPGRQESEGDVSSQSFNDVVAGAEHGQSAADGVEGEFDIIDEDGEFDIDGSEAGLGSSSGGGRMDADSEDEYDPEAQDYSSGETDLDSLRVVPASPSYFTGQPQFTDDLLRLNALLRACTTLPVVAPGSAPRVSWLTYAQYTETNSEPIRTSRYAQLVRVLQRLNQVEPSVLPPEVTEELARWKRAVQPSEQRKRPQQVDNFGRSRAVGRRKSSHAVVWLVEGDGQVRVNGRTLTDAFARLHDRESAVWALKATQRTDRYNVWAIVRGGGTTGQAEALTLGLAKALMVQEPALKPALRRAGCVRRDPRTVERKKAGHLKARKKPAWVKR